MRFPPSPKGTFLLIFLITSSTEGSEFCPFLVVSERPQKEVIKTMIALEAHRILSEKGVPSGSQYLFPTGENLLRLPLSPFTHLLILDIKPSFSGGGNSFRLEGSMIVKEVKTSREITTVTIFYEEGTPLIEKGIPLVERIRPPLEEGFQQILKTLPPSRESANCWEKTRIALAESDLDKDGIPDSLDLCPAQPETKNGFQDEDGCPDTIQVLEFQLINGEREPLSGEVQIFPPGNLIRSPQGTFLLSLLPGEYELTYRSQGYQPKTISLKVPTTQTKREVILERELPAPKPSKPSKPAPSEPKRKQEPTISKEEVLEKCVWRDRSCVERIEEYLSQNSDEELETLKKEVEKELRAKAEELYEKGVSAFRQERFSDARKLFEEALTLDPNNRKIAEAYEKAKRLEEGSR